MKLFIILLFVFSSFYAQAVNIPPRGIPTAAIKTFLQTFSKAGDVPWSIAHEFYRASFQVAGQRANAYFDENGALVVVTRYIKEVELPMVLLAKIHEQFAHYKVTEVLEASDETGLRYYITLQNTKQKIILRSNGDKKWEQYRKSRSKLSDSNLKAQ